MSASFAAPQRVAVIGAGAVGCYYGGRLAEAGRAVTFLMRRDLEAVRARGLRVTSPDGDFHLDAPRAVASPLEVGKVDWVICALKATAIEEARALIEPCLGAATRVLVLMNGLGLEKRFAEWLAPERVFAGLAFTCINRGEPGVVHHLDYGPLTLAHLLDEPSAVEEAAELWAGARVTLHTSTSLRRARWEKLCWNIPFNGLCVAAGGITTDRVLGDPALRAVAERAMAEVVAAGNADLAAHGARERIESAALIERMFALTSTMGAYRPSTLIDFLEGRPLEVDAMFREPLRRARNLEVPTPAIEMLAALLGALDPGGSESRSS
jgi:2-dehydropantoate 2-reductase